MAASRRIRGYPLPFSPRKTIDRWFARTGLPGPTAVLDRLAGPDRDASAASTGRMAASAFLARVASAVLAYAVQVLFARWMGGFEYGVYVVVWTLVVTFGVIFAFGFEQSVVTLLRRYAHESDHGTARGLLLAARLFAFSVSSLIAAAGAAILWTRPDLVADYRFAPLLVAALCLPIYTVAEIQDGIAVAEGWPDLALGPTFLMRPAAILLLVGIAFLVGVRLSATVACWAAVIATWSVTLGQLVALRRRLAVVVEAVPRRWAVGEGVTTTAPMALVDTFVVLLNAVDVLVVGTWADPAAVGVYFATVKTLALVHFVYYAAKVASAKRFASLWHAGDRDGLAAFVAVVGRWTFWATLAVTLAVLAIGRPLLALFGPGFADGWTLLFVLVIGVVARASVGPAETLLTMAGQQKASAVVYGVTLVVAFLATTALTPLFGIRGAAAGMTTALVVESILLAVTVRRRLGLDPFVLTAAKRDPVVAPAAAKE